MLFSKKSKTKSDLSKKMVKERLKEMPKWSLHDGCIEREYKFEDFKKAISFVDEVAQVAEKQNHHPDIFICYNNVTLDLSTHDAGGVTSRDFELAKELDRIA